MSVLHVLGPKPNSKILYLACLSGAQIGSNHEKNGGRKSHDTLP